MDGIKDIKDFTKYPSLSDNDLLLASKTDLGGTDAAINVGDFRKQIANDAKSEIKNGFWWVNGINTGVQAVGRTPVFRKTTDGLELKYEDEDDSAYQLLIPLSDLSFTFDDLSPEQVQKIKLKFSDLTDDDKASLRGEAFTYNMFTDEQLADLRLTWDKLTPEQKKEIQGERGYSAFEVWTQRAGNEGKTEEEYFSWLRVPATDAATKVLERMTEIEQSATEVITAVEAAKNTADQVIANVNTANNQAVEAENARVASELLRIEEEKKRTETEVARVEAEKLRLGKETERTEAEKLRLEKELERINAELARAEAEALRVQESKTAVDNAVAATELATDAAGVAQEVADHPVYIGSDHYVYKWNKETKAYDKTDIFVKGEAFSIKKVYASISEMEADTGNAEIKEGDFVLINTSDVENPDNARLYIKTASGFDFLVDMSGAIGFTGKTPQLGIGTVSGGETPAVSLSEDGTDSAGNPKFKLNLVLPKGEKGDTPILTAGTVTTGAPGTPATAELIADGTTDAGIPRYRLDLTIPEGRQGSGNVSVPPNALKAGVTYLFKPSADGSADGEFIEYVPAPQEQADWSVADAALPSFIRNKPESLPANGGNADTIQDVPLNAISHYLISGETYPLANDMIAPGFGYGYRQAGWATYGPFIIFGMPSSSSYAMQIQGSYNDTGAFYRTKNDINNAWNPWHQLAIHGEPQPASDVHPWAKQPSKPAYNFSEILGADNYVIHDDPNTAYSKTFVCTVKNTDGYISRLNLGLENTAGRFGRGIISVGLNDAGTLFTHWYFDPNNSRITTNGGNIVAFTSDTVEAANKLNNARAINGTYFDGTANITTEYWGKPRTIAFANDVTGAITIDGSQNLAPSIEVQQVTGTYSGNGGVQSPSFVPSGKIRWVMMNLQMQGDSNYKDFMLMDTYNGPDVPWITALAIDKNSTPRAWIVVGEKGNTIGWHNSAEIWTTNNFNPDSFQPKISYMDLGNVDYLHSFTFRGDYKYYYLTLLNSSSFAALPDATQNNGLEFTVIIFCAGMTTINLPTGANYVNMSGNTISVPRGSLNVEVNFLCIGNKWRSTFIIQPD